MKRTFTYQITNAEESSTILNFLKSQGYSRHILTGMKQFPGSILNNGVPAYGNTRLKAGDLLTVHLREKESDSEILPVNLPFGILYEDEDILVVNKPADMPIHPSMGNPDNTLANAVAWYYQQQGETFVYRCLNRLDRDTTGALILAKNALSAALLSASLQNRQVKRTYLAIVKGTLSVALILLFYIYILQFNAHFSHNYLFFLPHLFSHSSSSFTYGCSLP